MCGFKAGASAAAADQADNPQDKHGDRRSNHQDGKDLRERKGEQSGDGVSGAGNPAVDGEGVALGESGGKRRSQQQDKGRRIGEKDPASFEAEQVGTLLSETENRTGMRSGTRPRIFRS